MAYTTLKDAYAKIQNLETFGGNSLSARRYWYRDELIYVVFSYETPILAVECDGHSDFVLNKTKYSRTTSRHQGIIQRAIDNAFKLEHALEIYDLPYGALREFLAYLF